MVMTKPRRVTPAETREFVTDYTLYRFGHVLKPEDFARQAGVDAKCVDDLLAQKPLPEADLNRIARAIDVSPRLLSEIAGYREMDGETRLSLVRFFTVVKQQPKQRQARAA